VRGKARVIAVNNCYQIAPWADLLYACDQRWWDHYRPDFAGIKVTISQSAAKSYGLHLLRSENKAGFSLKWPKVHEGSNSGFQAVNLAILLGAKKIVLLGYDMGGSGHWHGYHGGNLRNPDETQFRRWRGAFQDAVTDIEHAGVEVINCTRDTALTCFPRANLEDVL
jgi:hypothetical protein